MSMFSIGTPDREAVHVQKHAEGYEKHAQDDAECDADLCIRVVSLVIRELPLWVRGPKRWPLRQ